MIKWCGIAIVCVVISGAALAWPYIRIERTLRLADLEKIQVGMSLDTVEKILHGPGTPIDVAQNGSPKLVVWTTEQGMLASLNVSLDVNFRVTEAICMPGMRRCGRPAGLVDRFRDWIGW